jgi:translation elongation factor EF-4
LQVVASTKINAYKKDFTTKLKGNFRDRGRVMKQLKKQEKGKDEMLSRYVGEVPIPKEAFIRLLTR